MAGEQRGAVHRCSMGNEIICLKEFSNSFIISRFHFAMRRSKKMKFLSVSVLFVIQLFLISNGSFATQSAEKTLDSTQNSEKILAESWRYFKQTFIKSGRVIRPQENNDTVSEGQSYTMLRAVLMNDQKTFDECLAWSEAALSREALFGDHLLAWHYENGKISDTNSASDADIDYAYSLILAYRTWQDKRYLTLANKVLQSILAEETTLVNGKRYMLPWHRSINKEGEPVAQNLSYYAPSQFKLFYEVSQDKSWLELVDTTYNLLQRFIDYPGAPHIGSLVPDWMALDQKGQISRLPGKSVEYGWDAVRIPLRIAADYYLYGDPRALQVLNWFSKNFEKEERWDLFHTTNNPYNNALFYSAQYAAMKAAGSSKAPEMLQRLRTCISSSENGLFYSDPQDYYSNSLAWLPEYFEKNKGEQLNRGIVSGFGSGAEQQSLSGWKLVWSDEFSGDAIDRTKWDFDIDNGFYTNDTKQWVSGWGNDELQHYSLDPENAFVKDGMLHIRAMKESLLSGYSSARLKTGGRFGNSLFCKRYGRFEFRVKLPVGKGLFPAIWLLPQDDAYGTWPASGEIDIIEAEGEKPNQILSAIHYGSRWPANRFVRKDYILPDNQIIADFHLYTLEWEPGEMRWYVDGSLYSMQSFWWSSSKTVNATGVEPTDESELNPWPAPFDQPFNIIMNLAVSGRVTGDPDQTTLFPADMVVDYVRVYDKTGTSGQLPARGAGLLPFGVKKNPIGELPPKKETP